MKREEEIKIAIDKIFSCVNNGRTYKQANAVCGFEDGVSLADNNPKSHWISVKEELPYNNPNFIHFGFTNRVLVRDKKWHVFVAYMKKNKDNKWIWCSDVKNSFDLLSNITHWAYIHNVSKE